MVHMTLLTNWVVFSAVFWDIGTLGKTENSKVLRIGSPGGQKLNWVSGSILPHSIHQNNDSGTKIQFCQNLHNYITLPNSTAVDLTMDLTMLPDDGQSPICVSETCAPALPRHVGGRTHQLPPDSHDQLVRTSRKPQSVGAHTSCQHVYY